MGIHGTMGYVNGDGIYWRGIFHDSGILYDIIILGICSDMGPNDGIIRISYNGIAHGISFFLRIQSCAEKGPWTPPLNIMPQFHFLRRYGWIYWDILICLSMLRVFVGMLIGGGE